MEPDILIVDEALSVGDIFFQNKCFKKFDELKTKGVTILFVSHDIGSVRQMCSRVCGWIMASRGFLEMLLKFAICIWMKKEKLLNMCQAIFKIIEGEIYLFKG